MGVLLFASCNSAVVQDKDDFDYNEETNSAVQQGASANTDDENIVQHHVVRIDADFDRDLDNSTATDLRADKKSRSKRSNRGRIGTCTSREDCCNGRCYPKGYYSDFDWVYVRYDDGYRPCKKICYFSDGLQREHTYYPGMRTFGCMSLAYVSQECGGYARN